MGMRAAPKISMAFLALTGVMPRAIRKLEIYPLERLRIGLQPGTTKIPDGQSYYALIRHEGWKLETVEGAELVDLTALGPRDEQKDAILTNGFPIRSALSTGGESSH